MTTRTIDRHATENAICDDFYRRHGEDELAEKRTEVAVMSDEELVDYARFCGVAVVYVPDTSSFAGSDTLLKARCVLAKHLVARGRDGEVDSDDAIVMTAGFAERIADVIDEVFQTVGYDRTISIDADEFTIAISVNIGGYLTRTCIDIDGSADFKIRRRLGGHKATVNPADSGRALINVIRDTCFRYAGDA